MTARGPAPLVVVHDTPTLHVALAEVRAAGWTVSDGFPATAAGARDLAGRVRSGVVRDTRTATDALLAVVRGSGLVAHLAAGPAVAERFLDDLLRLGAVDHRPAAPGPDTDGVDRRLLDLLLGGATVEEASRALFLSRRTAHRRLGALRARWDVPTTAQLLALVRHAGPDVPPAG